MAALSTTLPIAEQLEAIYIGYFGRAADAGGLATGSNIILRLIASGHHRRPDSDYHCEFFRGPSGNGGTLSVPGRQHYLVDNG